jgi:hypothetical protein
MSYTTYTISDYIASKSDLKSKIDAIDILIDKMILSVTESIDGVGSNISEYQLDDGQVKIKTSYRSIGEVKSGVDALEQLKQMYVNRFKGRVTVLRDEKIFRR